MTNTKYYNEHVSKTRGKPPKDDKILIDTGDYQEDPVREWQCPNCNYRLHARKSRKEIDCPNCTATLDLGGATQETKTLVNPNKSNAPNEVHVFTTNEPVNPWDKKPVEYKGAFAELAKRVHFTSYHEYDGAGRPISWERKEEEDE